ncbi:MAG: DUF4199 domain-containing protein [Rhodothermales bacterium]|nr:DUF4199 domain-containing protein [Rhodothermales bacterium]
MKGPIRWGVILGGAVAVLIFVFGLVGWHRTFEMSFVFLAIAILINGVAVVLCLHERASTHGWLSQVKNGLVVGLVGSVIIFFASWLVTSVVFPDYFTEMAAGYREMYVNMGMSEAEVTDLVAATANTSPVRSAVDGVVGTIATSLMVAAIAGVWLRKKD